MPVVAQRQVTRRSSSASTSGGAPMVSHGVGVNRRQVEPGGPSLAGSTVFQSSGHRWAVWRPGYMISPTYLGPQRSIEVTGCRPAGRRGPRNRSTARARSLLRCYTARFVGSCKYALSRQAGGAASDTIDAASRLLTTGQGGSRPGSDVSNRRIRARRISMTIRARLQEPLSRRQRRSADGASNRRAGGLAGGRLRCSAPSTSLHSR